MTFTAILPVVGRGNGRVTFELTVAQASSDVGPQGAAELVVGVVGAGEVGVADEEALAVVVGVDEPAGDVVGRAELRISPVVGS